VQEREASPRRRGPLPRHLRALSFPFSAATAGSAGTRGRGWWRIGDEWGGEVIRGGGDGSEVVVLVPAEPGLVRRTADMEADNWGEATQGRLSLVDPRTGSLAQR
jgi:hypothetical protein